MPADTATAVAAIALGALLLGLIALGLRWLRASRGSPAAHLPAPVALRANGLPPTANGEAAGLAGTPAGSPAPHSAPPEPHTGSPAGVLVAETGGRLVFANDRARQLFGLDAAPPSLDAVLRHTEPPETLLALLAAEGRASLRVGQRRLEATSLRLHTANGHAPQVVVMLREASRDLAPGSAEQLAQVTGLIRGFGASLDPQATYAAILNGLAGVFQFGLAEINLRDAATGRLRPVHYAGERNYPEELARAGTYYAAGEGYTGWLAEHRQPLLVPNIRQFDAARPKLFGPEFPFESYMGVPLLDEDELVGTLELAAYTPGAYTQADLDLLSLVAPHAAQAIRRARRHAEQQQRLAELAGLAEITRAIEATADPRALYARLAADIGRFLNVQWAGLLVYRPETRRLEGQPPFYGMPDIVAEVYHIPVTIDSPAERLFRQAERTPHWKSDDVPNDPLIDALGLRQFATATGTRTILLVPIALGGRPLGMVQVGNRLDGEPFTPEDARLLTSFAGQAAAILDNARLVREAERRAEEAESLRAIAAATAAGTDADSVLRLAMQQAARVLGFDLGMVVLLDEARGELVPHPASVYGGPVAEATAVTLRTSEPGFAHSITRTRRSFITGRALRDRRIAGFYKTLVERFQVNSAMSAALVAGDRSIGEIIVVAHREQAFTRANLRLLETIASQLASAIERARLYAATDQTLQRRVDQLTALTRVSRELNQTLKLDHILRLVLDEAVHTTRAGCGTIVLFDLEAAEPGTVALRIGDEELRTRLTLLEAEAVRSEQPRRRLADLPPDSPLAAHAEVRAALVVPILAQGQLAGLIHLHSEHAQGFTDDAEEAAHALAAQTAIAVENARRFDEQMRRGELLRRRADQLGQLFEVSRSVRSDRPLADNLEAIAFSLQEAVGFNVVLISVLDPKSRRLRRTAAAGLTVKQFEDISRVEPPWDDAARLLREEYRLSQSYFLPAEATAHLTATVSSVAVRQAVTGHAGPNAWQELDMLLVPLRGSGQEPVGLLTVDSPRDGRRPDRNTIEIIEIFANQAAQAIENARLYAAAERRAAQLLALHRVVEAASSVANRSRLWQTVAAMLLEELPGPDVCVLALRDEDAGAAYAAGLPHLTIVGQAGAIRPHIDFGPLLATDNPLAHAASERGPMLLLNAAETGWAESPLVAALEVGSFISLPIVSQGRPAGALFVGAIHRPDQPSPFSVEDLDVFTVLANQLGAALESIRLETDIQQRAAQLAALAQAAQNISATLRMEDVVQAVLDGLHAVLPYDSVTLWLREGSQMRIVAAQGFENNAERIGLRVDMADSALLAEMAATLAPILVPEARADPRFAAGEFQPTQSWLGAPLMSKGRILGVLALDKVEAHFYSPQAAQVLMAFASQAASALENARLFEESEDRTRELDERSQRLALLNRVSAQLGGMLNEAQIVGVILAEIRGALSIERARLAAFDAEGQPHLAGQDPLEPDEPVLALPALDHVREAGAPLAVESVTTDTLLGETGPALAERGVQSLLVVPLAVAGQVLAALQLEETEAPRRFTRGEIELAQTMANQAAVSVQNARLYAQTQATLAERTRAEHELRRRNAELEVLNRVTTAITSQLDMQALLAATAREIVQIFGARNSGIALLNAERTALAVVADYSARPEDPSAAGVVIPLEGNASSIHVVETGEALVLPRAFEHPLTTAIHPLLRERNTHCLMIVPLRVRGEVIGTIGLDTDQPEREFTPAEVSLVETIAGQIAGAVENARFAQELEARVAARTADVQRERERVEILLQVTTELSSSLDLERVLTRALQLVGEAIRADRGAIYLLDMESDRLIYRAALGPTRPLPPGGVPAPFKRSEGLIGWVIKNRQPVVIADVAQDPRWVPLPDFEPTYRSALVVPLMANEDALGAMVLLGPARYAFDEEQMRLVSASANQVGASINNAELYRLIRDQAERLGGMLRAQQVEATKSRAILEAIADGVLVADARGDVILFNVACERILGLERDSVIGRPAAEFVGIYGAAAHAWEAAVQRWSQDPDSYRPGDFVAQRITLDNQRVISVHLAPVIANDEYLGSVSVIRDITREVEVDRLKSEFVTNVSHELRTPMTSIKGYADLILMGAAGPLDPNQARFIEVIKNNADRLSLLVNDLLDISRIESGRVELVLRPTSLPEVLHEVAATLRGRVDQDSKPMNLNVEAPDDLPPVWGDRERITQIVMNLADNAFNYSPAGGRICLSAALAGDGREVVVEVTDSGVGIAPEHQPRLFDRFFRGEDALVLATAGTGLGLAIARQLAEMHGGRLWLARSQVGAGSTFALALPVAPPP